MAAAMLAAGALGALVAWLPSHDAAAASPPGILVNGRILPTEVPPLVVRGRALVPLRAVSESLEADVFWYAPERRILIVADGAEVSLVPGEARALVNGREVPLEVPAQIVKGRTLVPLRFVALALGVDVRWDASARRVVIRDGGRRASAGALDAFLAAAARLAEWRNYRADVRVTLYGSDGASVEGTGAVHQWRNGDSAAVLEFVLTTAQGFVVQAPPVEVRRVGGRVYGRLGKQPWEPADPAPEASGAQHVSRLAEAVRAHPELVRRAFEEPSPAGSGRRLGLVLDPRVRDLLDGRQGPVSGYRVLSLLLGPKGEPRTMEERVRVFDPADGTYATTTVTMSNLAPGQAEPVVAPSPAEMQPAGGAEPAGALGSSV